MKLEIMQKAISKRAVRGVLAQVKLFLLALA